MFSAVACDGGAVAQAVVRTAAPISAATIICRIDVIKRSFSTFRV
jgi:hypothetical protein